MSAAIVRVRGFCWAVWIAADKADLLVSKGGLNFAKWRDYTTSKAFSPFFTLGSRRRADTTPAITAVLTPRDYPCIILCSLGFEVYATRFSWKLF
jgi:hypothetical protein